jgi:hypothetical protein
VSWLDFDTSIVQPRPDTNKPGFWGQEGAAPGHLADSATLHRSNGRGAGVSDFYRRDVARAYIIRRQFEAVVMRMAGVLETGKGLSSGQILRLALWVLSSWV